MFHKTAKLLDDQNYVSMHAKASMRPFEYYTGFAPSGYKTDTCLAFPGGCRSYNLAGKAVDAYNGIIPGTVGFTRVIPSASTELFGGPFKARGEGILKNPDMLSAAWTPQGGFEKHCAKRLSEVSYVPYSMQCQTLPNQSEEAFDKRGGISTRMGIQYISSC